jgi:hypothetical protein
MRIGSSTILSIMLFLNFDALHPTTDSKETFLEKKKT